MQGISSGFAAGVYYRIIAAVLTLVSFFTVAKPQNVTLTVVSASAQTVVVAYKNGTGKVISPEQRWLLEEKTAEDWTPLPFVDGFGWVEIAERCLPTAGGTRTVDAERCFGRQLAAGTYRFTLYYTCERVSGGERSVSVEFTIIQE